MTDTAQGSKYSSKLLCCAASGIDWTEAQLPLHGGGTRARINPMKFSIAADWAALEDHFEQHDAKQVDRFRHLGRNAVRRMWSSQTNEDGKPLCQFERDALIERHCELFGIWPN